MSTIRFLPFVPSVPSVTTESPAGKSDKAPEPQGAHGGAAGAVFPARSAFVAKGQSRRSKIFNDYKTSKQSDASAGLSVTDTAANLGIREGAFAALAGLAVSADTVVGYGGQTLAEEQKMFQGFVQPGIQDPQHEARQCLEFAGKVFGQEDVKRLPDDIATAFAREGSRFHALAKEVLNRGLLPLDTLVGLSTVGKEVKSFGVMRMGF